MFISSDTEFPIADLQFVDTDMPKWFNNAFSVERKEGWVDCGGTNIHYFSWGNPSNPGVILTHGFMAHARCWAFIAPLLAENYHLVAFDLSGMGDSGWRENYTVLDRVDEAKAVAEHLGMTRLNKKPFLVCHSYGGSVGLSAAEEESDAWGGLIVCDMTMLAPDEISDFESYRKKRQQRGVKPHRVSDTLEAAKKRFRLAPEQPCENRFLLEYMAYHSLKKVEKGWVWKFDPRILGPDEERSSDWWQSLSNRFANMKVPRAVIYGEHSQMFSRRAADYIRSNTSDNIPMVQINNAYHHIMLDQPLAFSSAINALLQGFLDTDSNSEV